MSEATKTKAGRGPTKKRGRNREALLAEAARQINERGVGALVLNDIAEVVGLSRNTLYYYVTDRADLVFRCYLRACEAMTEDLAVAIEDGADAPSRLALFIDRSLTQEREPLTVLADIDFLPQPRRQMIADLHQRNVETLQDIMADGVAEGTLRPANLEIAAQSLVGMLSWARLSGKWLGARDNPAVRRRMAAAIRLLVLDGIAASSQSDIACEIDVDSLMARPFNAFDRQQTTEIKITQLVAAASRLFNRRGIDGASLDDISASVGATKGAVYHYFDDKTALVVRCYERAFQLFDTFMDAAYASTEDGLKRGLTVLHLNVQAQAGTLSPLMLQPGALAVPEADRTRFIAAAQKLRRASTRSLSLAGRQGGARPFAPAFVAEATAGIFLWLPKWLPDDYPLTPIQIADEISTLAALGLKVRRA